MEQQHYDLAVIGSGPGGYVGAIRAAQLGLSTVCIDRDKLGGVCLNWGCIPSKALLHGAELYRELAVHGCDWGFSCDGLSVDWQAFIARSRSITGQLNNGVAHLFKKHGIEHIEGHARIEQGSSEGQPCRIAIGPASGSYYGGTGEEPTRSITADHILIATGAKPRQLPFAPCDGERIIDSAQAMSLPSQPQSMVIIGSGAIGMEFAYLYNALGTQVTVIEMLDRILPAEDEEISKLAQRAFSRQGLTLHTAAGVRSIETNDEGVAVIFAGVEDGSPQQVVEGDCVLVAIGVEARHDGLFEESLGLAIEGGFIATDARSADSPTYTTSVSGVHAIGDVIGPPLLAHVASEEAITCVERIAGHEVIGVDYDAIPACTYTSPQIASIGRSEQQLIDAGVEFTKGVYSLKAHGKAIAVGAADGIVKLLASKPYGEILGAHIIGKDASELIAEIGLAMRLEATAEDIISTMHAHPTMAEAVHEAALGIEDRMIHN